VTDFSVFVSIFSVFLWYLMSHSNVSKNAVSDLLRIAETDSQ